MSHALKTFFVDNSYYVFSYEYCLARVLIVFNFLNVPVDVTLFLEPPSLKLWRSRYGTFGNWFTRADLSPVSLPLAIAHDKERWCYLLRLFYVLQLYFYLYFVIPRHEVSTLVFVPCAENFFVDNSDHCFRYEYCLARVLIVFKFLNVPFDVT